MKFILMITAFTAGITLGFIPPISKARRSYWKAIVIAINLMALALTLLPPLASSPAIIDYLAENNYTGDIYIKAYVSQPAKKADGFGASVVELKDSPNGAAIVTATIAQGVSIQDIRPDDHLVLKTSFNTSRITPEILSIVAINPPVIYSFVPGLGNKIRILNLHVPVAWTAFLAFVLSTIFSVQYLRTRQRKFDDYSSISAGLGTLYAVGATITGMLWAKFSWGSFWNWDPRETSIVVLLFIYLAYFALRASVTDPDRKARLSSVYSIISFITVPFLFFVLPRITTSLHPGSADGSMGPVLSKQGSMLDESLSVAFALSLTGATLIFSWILNICIRLKIVQQTQKI